MGLFKKKSRVERFSMVLNQDYNVYDWHSEKGEKKWLKDLDKVFKDMKKNGVPDELKDFLAYRYPFHCWEYDLKEMERVIMQTKEMSMLLLEEKVLPANIGKLVNLEILNLAHNGLKSIPDEIVNLQKLKTLVIGGNPINPFPENITELASLQELIFGRSPIKCIPDSLIKLHQLKLLHLIDVQFETFPSILTEMNALQELNLMENHITEIPQSISKLNKLETLNLANNPIKILPQEMSKMTSLKYLNLQHVILPKNLASNLHKWLPHTEITF